VKIVGVTIVVSMLTPLDRRAVSRIRCLNRSKSFRRDDTMKDRASFEFRASCINVLNHPNFLSVDPFVEDAGNFGPFNGFGNPQVSDTVPGFINFPNSASRRLIFGGVFRF